MLKNEILRLYKPRAGQPTNLPQYISRVQAGFPSPADDYIEGFIDLNKLFVKDKAASFFLYVGGDSMSGDGILEGDLLLVDRSIDPYDGCVAICWYDGEFTVKRVLFREGEITLMPSNPKYKPVTFREGDELVIWGVVGSVHRDLMK